MTIAEIIGKCAIRYHDETTVQLLNEATAEDKKYIVAHKAEIIAELKARKEAESARKAKEIRDNATELEGIKGSKIAITAEYHDGEYLSGYAVCGNGARLLEEVGACKYIEGWGYYVERKTVKALGETFTLAQATEYMAPANAEKAEKAAAQKADLDAKFSEAEATGKPVEIRRWMSECHGSHADCSFDSNVEYAMPDGTTKIEWDHCY